MTIFEFSLFGLKIAPTYYALMYILGFIAAGIFVKKTIHWRNPRDLDELIFYAGIGVILWGRLGYIVFYNLPYYLSMPQKIFAIWEWGMSFHWGFIGVLLGVYIFCKRYRYRFWNTLDSIAVITPVGLWLWRFANYLNNELFGFSPYYGPFPMIINGVPHFPSPLGEMLLEGILLFFILLWAFFCTNLKKTPGRIAGIFAIGYGVSRIIMEFFRLPDANVGYLFGSNFITLGMIYSLPMILIGVYLQVRKQ